MLPTYRAPRRPLIAPRPAPPLAQESGVKLLPPHGFTEAEARCLEFSPIPPVNLTAVILELITLLDEQDTAAMVDSAQTSSADAQQYP